MLFRTTRVRCKICNGESENVDCVNSQQDPMEELQCSSANHHSLAPGGPITDCEQISVSYSEQTGRGVMASVYKGGIVSSLRSFPKPTAEEVAEIDRRLDETAAELAGEAFSEEEATSARSAVQRVRDRYRQPAA